MLALHSRKRCMYQTCQTLIRNHSIKVLRSHLTGLLTSSSRPLGHVWQVSSGGVTSDKEHQKSHQPFVTPPEGSKLLKAFLFSLKRRVVGTEVANAAGKEGRKRKGRGQDRRGGEEKREGEKKKEREGRGGEEKTD